MRMQNFCGMLLQLNVIKHNKCALRCIPYGTKKNVHAKLDCGFVQCCKQQYFVSIRCQQFQRTKLYNCVNRSVLLVKINSGKKY